MFNVADFVGACRAVAGTDGAPAKVFELVRAAVADPVGVRAAVDAQATEVADFDGLLFHSIDLTVVAVDLQPGEVSVPHDHRMWAVIGVYEGAERNSFFARSNGGLEPAGEQTVTAGEVLLLREDTIHAIENAADRVLRGIHVYGGDLTAIPRSMWHAETGAEHEFQFSVFEAWNSELQLRRAGQDTPKEVG